MQQIIDFERYPVNDLGSAPAQSWIALIRAQLDHDGSFVFTDFLTPGALQEMAAEANALANLAYPGPSEVSPYFFNYHLGEGKQLPDSHPLKRKGRRNLAQVAGDLIPDDSLLARLHRSQEMRDFLAAINQTPVYLNEDPYQGLNISVMNQGGCQQWHFDSGTLVTTLLLQAPEGGGEFEYAPMIRSDQDENFPAVQAVLDGTRDAVKTIKLQAGCLSLFRGHYSLHRVTEVTGSRQRLQAILGYSNRPAHIGSKDSSILHYGPRVAEIEASNPRYLD